MIQTRDNLENLNILVVMLSSRLDILPRITELMQPTFTYYAFTENNANSIISLIQSCLTFYILRIRPDNFKERYVGFDSLLCIT